mmetsp:Transcript_322/g.1368  ORF Transcript_322/g.1368 Transcript_322/m.1368 type:complete len:225 (+) Transcript_322:3-677(+)
MSYGRLPHNGAAPSHQASILHAYDRQLHDLVQDLLHYEIQQLLLHALRENGHIDAGVEGGHQGLPNVRSYNLLQLGGLDLGVFGLVQQDRDRSHPIFRHEGGHALPQFLVRLLDGAFDEPPLCGLREQPDVDALIDSVDDAVDLAVAEHVRLLAARWRQVPLVGLLSVHPSSTVAPSDPRVVWIHFTCDAFTARQQRDPAGPSIDREGEIGTLARERIAAVLVA